MALIRYVDHRIVKNPPFVWCACHRQVYVWRDVWTWI